jgi:hypothetical protein
MDKFRKKPVVIEALQFTGTADNSFEVGDFIAGATTWAIHSERLRIDTLEGRMWADIGDWVIKGVKGEFYPCKPEIFALTYDRVEE